MHIIPSNTSEPDSSRIWVNFLQIKPCSSSQWAVISHKCLLFNKLQTRTIHLMSKITDRYKGWANAKSFLLIFPIPKDSQQSLDFLLRCKDVPTDLIKIRLILESYLVSQHNSVCFKIQTIPVQPLTSTCTLTFPSFFFTFWLCQFTFLWPLVCLEVPS